jgi:Ca2+-binding EF-hand superfamily protein
MLWRSGVNAAGRPIVINLFYSPKEIPMFRQLALVTLVASVAALVPLAAANAQQQGMKLEERFKQADKDNDGTLDKNEAKAMPRVEKNFDAIDKDKDGTVSLEEIRASMKAARKEMHEHGMERFKAADKDHDGSLDREEAKAMPRVAKNFDAIDTDKSGTVTEKEIHDYMKAHRGDQMKDGHMMDEHMKDGHMDGGKTKQ